MSGQSASSIQTNVARREEEGSATFEPPRRYFSFVRGSTCRISCGIHVQILADGYLYSHYNSRFGDNRPSFSFVFVFLVNVSFVDGVRSIL